MSKAITATKLGELMQHWHDSQSDPIYRVGSLLYAGKPVDEQDVRKARENIRSLLKSAERGSHGMGQAEVSELKTISDGLASLLRVYRFGEMPTLKDFRDHLSHDLDPQGRRYINSGKPILEFDLQGRFAHEAVQGKARADKNRASGGKGPTAIDWSEESVSGRWVTKLKVQNIESLHDWIAALAESQPDGARLAKTIIEDLGYSWVGRGNPVDGLVGSQKQVEWATKIIDKFERLTKRAGDSVREGRYSWISRGAREKFAEFAERRRAEVLKNTKASWWINNRFFLESEGSWINTLTKEFKG